MGIFRRKVPSHYIPIHPENITKKDWVILLEVGTIVGSPAETIRVAVATLDKKLSRNTTFFCEKHTTSFSKGAIRGFTRCIFVPALQIQLG
jgi:hypothetical protein